MPIEFIRPSLQVLRTQIWNEISRNWSATWSQQRSTHYVSNTLPSETRLKRYHSQLKLAESSILSQFRTNHTTLNASLQRFHPHLSTRCHCGRVETSKHFLLECTSYQGLRNDLRKSITAINNSAKLTLKNLLDSDIFGKITAKFIQRAMAQRNRIIQNS